MNVTKQKCRGCEESRELIEAGELKGLCSECANLYFGALKGIHRICVQCGASMWANAIEVRGKEICTQCGCSTERS